MTIVVTGSGRSGTHWLANTLGQFVDAHHEPAEIAGDVVVDCRIVQEIAEVAARHRIVHLVRDGRDVCRSKYAAYSGRRPWATICRDWARDVDATDEHAAQVVRLEDLLMRQDPTREGHHHLPPWQEWDDQTRATFWGNCGAQMRRHGYK